MWTTCRAPGKYNIFGRKPESQPPVARQPSQAVTRQMTDQALHFKTILKFLEKGHEETIHFSRFFSRGIRIPYKRSHAHAHGGPGI
jgi:hypothetical protein